MVGGVIKGSKAGERKHVYKAVLGQDGRGPAEASFRARHPGKSRPSLLLRNSSLLLPASSLLWPRTFLSSQSSVLPLTGTFTVLSVLFIEDW